jgi:hypothetical protein
MSEHKVFKIILFLISLTDNRITICSNNNSNSESRRVISRDWEGCRETF